MSSLVTAMRTIQDLFYLDSFCNLLKICDYHAFGGQDNSASKGKAAAKSFCDHISMGLS